MPQAHALITGDAYLPVSASGANHWSAAVLVALETCEDNPKWQPSRPSGSVVEVLSHQSMHATITQANLYSNSSSSGSSSSSHTKWW